MTNMPWLKLYTEIRTDPKMLALTDTEFRVWISMLCLAAEAKDRGTICIAPDVAYPIEALSRALFIDANSLSAALAKFEALRMVEVDEDGIITISHFIKRQYEKPSAQPDQVRERVAKHRSAKKMAEMAQAASEVAATSDVVTLSDGNADVTPMKRPSNATDKDVDIDSDKEGDIVPPNPPLTGGPQSSDEPPEPKSSRKEHRKKQEDDPAKTTYAEFVHMTEAEYQQLVTDYGLSDTLRMIKILDNYKGSSGKTYRSDYRAILSWVVKRIQEEKGKEQLHSRAAPAYEAHDGMILSPKTRANLALVEKYRRMEAEKHEPSPNG